jgi:hypothetical protein
MQEQLKGTHNVWIKKKPCVAKSYNGYQFLHKYY